MSTKNVMKLRTWRIKAGLTQQEVANKLNLGTAQSVSNWERGKIHIPPIHLKPLSELYGVSIKTLSRALILPRRMQDYLKALKE